MTEPNAGPVRGRIWVPVGFSAFMLALTVLFASLGFWQVDRLGQKEQALAAIAERENLPPIGLPPVAEWVGFDPEVFDYRPVQVTGTFRHDQTIRIFTSVPTEDAQGVYSGAGYWVLAPLVLEGGGSVWINRGFVPESQAGAFVDGGAGPVGTVTLTGLARRGEPGNQFTPAADPMLRIDWMRNPERLAAISDPALAPYAPVYIDLPAGPEGALPQGGETILAISNRHLEYALTWFAFAGMTPLLLGFWLWRRLRPGANALAGTDSVN